MPTALITGSGKNIGRGIALALAQDGFNLVINGATNQSAVDETVAATQALGVEALGVMADIGEAESLDRLISAAMDAFGGVDVLVNNAAIRPSVGFLEMTDADWNRVRAVNLDAVYSLCKAFLPGMVERGFGRIVNFTGMHAMRGYVGRAHVSTTKHAVWGLTKSLGKEAATNGVCVNCITPAAVKTRIFDQITQEHIDYMLSKIPMGRFGLVEEMAALVAWLTSSECSFTTGGVFDISGGRATY